MANLDRVPAQAPELDGAQDAPANEDAYQAILAAVMETARGRWFLAEYARRNRTADTEILLEALGRLEATITEGKETAHPTAAAAGRLLPIEGVSARTARVETPLAAENPRPVGEEKPKAQMPEPAPAAASASPASGQASHLATDAAMKTLASRISALSFEERLALFS